MQAHGRRLERGPSDSATAAPSGSASAPPAATAAPSGSADADGAAPEASGSAAAQAPGKCPEATNAERVIAYDWSKELGVDAPTAARLRGVGGTAVEARLLAAKVSTELRNACAGLASELGNRGSFANASVACQAAVDGLKATRAKLGPAAKVSVHVHPAFCAESMEDVKACSKRCSGADEAPDAACVGATVGRCAGTCEGACEVRQPGVCEGTCLGECEGGFTGTCEGTCKGKCNGQALKGGECKGKCEGTCDAVPARGGECKGRCVGGCQLHAAACPGTCAGRCSVAIQDPRCLGTVKVATASAECASYCELYAVHRMACGAAQVDVLVGGAKDAAAASAYTGAIQRHLPVVLKLEQQLKGHVEVLGKAKAAVTDGVKAITAGGGAATPALSSCVFSYDKATGEGAASLAENYRSVNEVAVTARAK